MKRILIIVFMFWGVFIVFGMPPKLCGEVVGPQKFEFSQQGPLVMPEGLMVLGGQSWADMCEKRSSDSPQQESAPQTAEPQEANDSWRYDPYTPSPNVQESIPLDNQSKSVFSPKEEIKTHNFLSCELCGKKIHFPPLHEGQTCPGCDWGTISPMNSLEHNVFKERYNAVSQFVPQKKRGRNRFYNIRCRTYKKVAIMTMLVQKGWSEEAARNYMIENNRTKFDELHANVTAL